MPDKYTATQVLDALDRSSFAWASKGVLALLREVTMDDPDQVLMRAAWYKSRYPDYYASAQGQKSAIGRINTTGLNPESYNPRTPAYRRIDALMIGKTMASAERMRTAIEVKVTRADFRRETDEKRRAWMGHCHRFVYLAPEGVIPILEVPDGCGLWEMHPSGGVSIARKAKINPDPLPLFSESFAAYLAGRASRAEASNRLLKAQWARDLEGVSAMNARIAELERALEARG